MRRYLTLLLALGSLCSARAAEPAPSPELVLLLPGLGDNRQTRPCLDGLASAVAPEGHTVVVADYQKRRSVEASSEALREFINAQHPARYPRVHVVAWILGGWALNTVLQDSEIPNLASVVYDRSPTQERAPGAAVRVARPVIWLLMGHLVRDLSRTPYPAWQPSPGVKVGLFVENRASSLMARLKRVGQSYGPLDYSPEAFGQTHDDLMYSPVDHDRTYLRHDLWWPELSHFFREGRFSEGALRTPMSGDPWQEPDLEKQCRLPG